jgi:hypothetical protein
MSPYTSGGYISGRVQESVLPQARAMRHASSRFLSFILDFEEETGTKRVFCNPWLVGRCIKKDG